MGTCCRCSVNKCHHSRLLLGTDLGADEFTQRNLGANVGPTGNEREVHFDWLGRIVYRGGGVALDAHMQRAGYLLFDGREATGGDQLVFLQLAP